LVTKDTNTIIGTAGLVNREGLDGVDIGFALLPNYEGKGYGYEATKAIMQYATRTYGINTYLAITLPSNKPSQRLLEKLGLTFKKMIFIPNDPEELMLYST
jgi:RimJ/RimL family protein N-acetyltransferase